jgi:two-component system cell cycle response regulator DivK
VSQSEEPHERRAGPFDPVTEPGPKGSGQRVDPGKAALDAAGATAPKSAIPSKSLAKILLVEDNDVNADMLMRRLTRRGFVVVRACDGRQAVTLAQQEQPDLILIDMSLPEIDGWEATRRIKGDPATAAIPLIALTAHAMVSDREQSLAAGCNDFETKPVDLERLLAKMAMLLNAGVRNG